MATFIQAVAQYGPRLQRRPKVAMKELSTRLADVTGVRKSEIVRILLELQSAMQFYHKLGAAVELPNIGTFTPSLRSDGRIFVLYRPDRDFRKEVGHISVFEGNVINRDNLGLTPEDYKVLWDADHPDDLLEFPPHMLPKADADGVMAMASAAVRRRAKRKWWRW